MFAFREHIDLDPVPARGGRVEVAFTDASVDLRDAAPEPGGPGAVTAALGVPVARTDQVHGDHVHHVRTLPLPGEPAPAADGQVTDLSGVALMVRVADCVPVVLVGRAADSSVLGVAHAGRRGVEVDVVARVVEAMAGLGAAPDGVRAWIGPHVCGRCYEVPAAMRDEVAARVPATAATTSWGTPALDLGAGVEAQLRAGGVADVVRVPGCTREDERWHSYRRDGAAAGRGAGLVRSWTP